ncbi:MAG: LON peptidase substrate-binding domain-containing protein [Massilia sp.]|nr:LON peptidase substrate-binding domain-containing protein [Aquabacterium sp.]
MSTPMDFTALPLFPLHTVLFPGGLLSLQIFEVRYLDLMKRCEKTGEPFGVVSLQSGHEVRRAPRPGETETLAPIGTLATLERIEHPQPGLMLIQARGTQRFTLQSSHLLPHGLWTCAIQLIPDDIPAAVPAELASFSQRLQGTLTAMAGQDDTLPLPAPPDDPRWQDAGWLANRWAECLPLPAAERQRLMSLDNPLWRLELVTEWLERLGQHPGP